MDRFAGSSAQVHHHPTPPPGPVSGALVVRADLGHRLSDRPCASVSGSAPAEAPPSPPCGHDDAWFRPPGLPGHPSSPSWSGCLQRERPKPMPPRSARHSSAPGVAGSPRCGPAVRRAAVASCPASRRVRAEAQVGARLVLDQSRLRPRWPRGRRPLAGGARGAAGCSAGAKPLPSAPP